MYGTHNSAPIVAAGSAGTLAATGASSISVVLVGVTVLFTGFVLTRLSRRAWNAGRN